jgi:hypothetical protein
MPYDTAQICRNGHIINALRKLAPQSSRAYCDRCGAEAIANCPQCAGEIRGQSFFYVGSRPRMRAAMSAPAFCEKCGKPYPWIEARLQAARDLAGQLDLDIPERTLLENSIEEIVRDTPRAPTEAVRFKSIAEKAKPWALGAFKEILFGVVGEGVKKMIWP